MDATGPFKIWMALAFGAMAIGCIVLRIKGLPPHDLLTVGTMIAVAGCWPIGMWQKRRTRVGCSKP